MGSSKPPAGRNAYLEFVREYLSSLGGVTSRAMMGGHVLYCDGFVFALVARETLYLKADKLSRAEFEAAGWPAFRPFEDQDLQMQYYRAPAEFFEDPDELARWGKLAVEAGKRGAKKKPRR